MVRSVGRRRTWFALIAAAALCATGPSAAQVAGGARKLRVQFLDVASALYAFLDGGGTTLVFDRDDGVVLVDPKSAGWGPTILENVVAITDRPVTTIIATHAHADHAGALDEFPGAKRIVVHEATARRLHAASGGRVPLTIVTDKLSLYAEAPRVDVYYFGRGHTDGDLVVAFPDQGIVHMGDLFPTKAAPVIDVANGGSAVALADTLARAVSELKGFRRVSTGHDPMATRTPMSWKDLQDYAEFNRLFLDQVRDAAARGQTAAQAAASLQMPEKFKGYDMQQASANAEAIYRELGR